MKIGLEKYTIYSSNKNDKIPGNKSILFIQAIKTIKPQWNSKIMQTYLN